MLKPFFKLGALAFAAVLILPACKYKPGATQSPKNMSVLVKQPCYTIKKLGSGSFQDVNFNTKIIVLTSNNNSASSLVTYGQPITDSRSSSQNAPSIPNEEYTVAQPSAFSYYGMIAEISTTTCGWPIINAPSNINYIKGGKVQYKAITPALPVPTNYVFYPNNFITISMQSC
jgi:hypothetical protein